jgi:hypothetical protein
LLLISYSGDAGGGSLDAGRSRRTVAGPLQLNIVFISAHHEMGSPERRDGKGMGLRPWFATRERVAAAAGYTMGAADVEAIDDACADATDTITKRSGWVNIHPEYSTRYFDRPADDYNFGVDFYRLDLGRNILVAAETVTAGGTVIAAGTGGYYPWPDDGTRVDEPIRELRLDRSGSASWATGSANTPQRQVAIAGAPWGWSDDSRSAGVLAAAIASTTAETLELTNGGRVGVGSLLRVGDERFVVTDKYAVATADTLATGLAAVADNAIPDAVAVADGTDYAVGEVIGVDAENMAIERIVGDTLYVRRAVCGTHLDDHLAGATIYAMRGCTVERGSVGTTAATHVDAAPVSVWCPPDPLVRLAVALAVSTAAQEGALYGRSSGSGQNERDQNANALADAWERACPYFRKGRTYAI